MEYVRTVQCSSQRAAPTCILGSYGHLESFSRVSWLPNRVQPAQSIRIPGCPPARSPGGVTVCSFRTVLFQIHLIISLITEMMMAIVSCCLIISLSHWNTVRSRIRTLTGDPQIHKKYHSKRQCSSLSTALTTLPRTSLRRMLAAVIREAEDRQELKETRCCSLHLIIKSPF